ncbi:MAG: type II toxin-antitoxin system VapC family toxin [Planctomycetes bacterium]|nr:type II toxin-antitoxin system VapC family toxin [Planctomycetota bacterium]
MVIAARQETTRDLWAKLNVDFRAYVSALVYQEAGQGDPDQARRRLEAIAAFPMLDIDDEAQNLAREIIAGKAIPEESPEDALHIAVATVNGVEILVTWNFSHLNNPFTRSLIRQVVEEAGYECPEICSPDELLEASP